MPEARRTDGPPIYFDLSTNPLIFNKPLLTLTFGGMWLLPQHRGGACFCTRGAIQGYDVVLFILALAKTVTPAGVPGGSRGRPHRRPLNVPL